VQGKAQSRAERAKRIRYVEYVDDGLAPFAAAEEAQLESIVAKRALAPYCRGRTGDWIKYNRGSGVEDCGKWTER
jgi:ATP-dependent DNA ligase